ncbi:hypothetical protein OKE68_10420 [Riemerella anatipestifer]|uniref:Uncharacterized protein n=1 Tax=Riemerella anatipestifer TaxID=34085 RepID=A0AAP3EXF0_RIEAN|nr:hypothetical protein [Riemerella anatipestifer]MBT0572483.1 hypothetical protein [Riemerella anatipestifer]MBT0573676.1 hypothetical protein [Riemerella anatipestifer]MCU7560052.1 hypothetical protein [Riemerella anatipestifer]MCU7569486.1 hypothetical protein [Riemerella anatipestifer]MCW0491499.1 hypothetical protein [Riemerella anatipestifer]
MSTITVEISIDEFSTDVLLNEIESRLKIQFYKDEITKRLREMLKSKYILDNQLLKPKNIIEESKIKFFIENFDHISEEDLETIVRSKNK